MGKLKKLGLLILLVTFNLLAAGVIFYFWQPIASWYLNYRPILGVDFYNFASYVEYLNRHFVWQFNGWKYTWWTGGPLFVDYPILHAYLVLPLLRWFSFQLAIQYYVLGSSFLFFFFSFLLFSEIGKDKFLALVLSVASAFSIGFWGALVWGGSLPYFATQFFLPLTLWFLIKFLRSRNKRWFFLSALFAGISFLGHPQVAFSFILPISFLLLLFYVPDGEKLISLGRIKRVFVFLGVSILAGYPALYNYLAINPKDLLERILGIPFALIPKMPSSSGVSASGAPAAEGAEPVFTAADYNRLQLGRFLNDTNALFFYFLIFAVIIFVLAFLIRKKRKRSLQTLVFLLPIFWVVFYGSLFGFGINLFHGGWYRVFWPVPLVLGMFISFALADFWEGLKERFTIFGNRILNLALRGSFGVLVLIVGFVLLSQNSAQKMIASMDNALYRQQNSAFPDSLGVYTKKDDFDQLKKKLVPSWLNPNDTNYRFYDADQRVNIWWNALYDMPLVKGYIELPPGDAATGSFYWTSVALTATGGSVDTLVKQWGTPEEMAFNNSLFLIDWFGIKYLEAEHERTDSYNPFTSYIRESDIFKNKEKVSIPGWPELYYLKKGESGPIIWHPEVEEYLTYYEVKDELASPILSPTNAPLLGIIGRLDAYNTLIRNLGALNLNSRNVIPIRLGQFVDDVPFESLKDMDALILYAYDYKNHAQAWAKIEKYVKEGGKVFIETGSEVKQTDSINLPAPYPSELPNVFPIAKTKKGQMGQAWDLLGSEQIEDINLAEFGPPVLDGQPWYFSLPEGSLKEGAEAILSNYGTPLVAARPYFKGKVYWSGMNLPYHMNTSKSLEEAKFLKVLLDELVDSTPLPVAEFETARKANSATIKSAKSKGILFKENSNPGWKATLSSAQRNTDLKIYKTGITFHGFSYVKIPKDVQDFTLTFSYQGEFWVYFWTIVWLLTILSILDYVLVKGRFFGPVFRKINSFTKKKIKSEEEEY